MALESETYTSKELCQRYGCAQVTLRRKEAEEGFPHGEKYGRKIVYSKKAVHAWERIHMPGLHPEAPPSDDDEAFSLVARRIRLERDEKAAQKLAKPVPKKPPKPAKKTNSVKQNLRRAA